MIKNSCFEPTVVTFQSKEFTQPAVWDQNTDTRIYDHITLVLIELHWLPVKKRIVFKKYCFLPLTSTWSATQPSLGLHSDNQLQLVVSRTHLVTYGGTAFSAATANLWNSIPEAIRMCNTVTTFKIWIKTYLFNLAYPINQWFYQTLNSLCWQVLLIKCDGCGYVFLFKFYPMCFIHCSALLTLSTAKKALYKCAITLHYIMQHKLTG